MIMCALLWSQFHYTLCNGWCIQILWNLYNRIRYIMSNWEENKPVKALHWGRKVAGLTQTIYNAKCLSCHHPLVLYFSAFWWQKSARSVTHTGEGKKKRTREDQCLDWNGSEVSDRLVSLVTAWPSFVKPGLDGISLRELRTANCCDWGCPGGKQWERGTHPKKK